MTICSEHEAKALILNEIQGPSRGESLSPVTPQTTQTPAQPNTIQQGQTHHQTTQHHTPLKQLNNLVPGNPIVTPVTTNAYANQDFEHQHYNNHNDYNVMINAGAPTLHQGVNEFSDENYYNCYNYYNPREPNPAMRPFSTSPTSCSSSESEQQPSQNMLNSQHAVTPQLQASAAYSNNCLRPHFELNCFNNGNDVNIHHNDHHHDVGFGVNDNGPQYTSVIVEPHNFQMSNEYVH